MLTPGRWRGPRRSDGPPADHSTLAEASTARGGETGGNMRHELEEEHTVECSGQIILVCKECWETTILLGLEKDWISEDRKNFTCECGQSLNLERDRGREEVVSVRRLLRGTITPTDGGGGSVDN